VSKVHIARVYRRFFSVEALSRDSRKSFITWLHACAHGVSSIRIHGVAIFNLRKDPDVALLDLQVAGVRNISTIEEEFPEQYEKLLKLAEKEFHKLIPKDLQKVSYVGEVNKRQILVRMYIDEEGKVVKTLIISLRSGVLRALSRKLERFGWQRALLFEIRRIPHKASADY